MLKTTLICAWVVCIGSAINMSAWAHPISLSSTIVNVHANRIDVEIEITLEDLVLFHQLKANGEMNYAADDMKSAAQKHRQFLLGYFTILAASCQIAQRHWVLSVRDVHFESDQSDVGRQRRE